MASYLPGDIVSRRKGFVMHKGVALSDGRILHNTPFRGEHVCSEAEFRAGKRLHVNRMDYHHRRRALRFTEDHDHRGYNLFTNNCEHTVHRATTGNASSPQLREWVIGIGLGTLAFAVTRHPGAAAAAYALGRGLSKKFS
ncbi:MAG: hypothetical protein O3A63_01320 [Proteobacteria bacterium]|nr:hypothetical protein [Pseudomonadota bacterium]